MRQTWRRFGTIDKVALRNIRQAGAQGIVTALCRIATGEVRSREAIKTAGPMRPDHGQDILDDQRRGGVPGYPAMGRLKGLAELGGVALALEHAGWAE